MNPFQLTLTSLQAAYLQNYLPTSYSLQTATLQAKRQRTAKKIDESFTSEFTLLPLKKISVSAKNHQNVSSTPKAIENDYVLNKPTETIIHQQGKTVQKQIVKQTETSNKKTEASLNALIEKLLKMLKNCKYSWPFRNPVDLVADDVVNQSGVTKQPINLRTVQNKYRAGEYTSFEDFDEDIRTIITNSYQSNQSDTNYYAVTIEFQAFYLDAVKLNLKKPQCKLKSATKVKEVENVEKKLQIVDMPFQKGAVNKVKVNENKLQKKYEQTSVGARQKEDKTQSSVPMAVHKSPMKQLNFRERERIFNKIDKLNQQDLRNFIKLCGVKASDDWLQVEIDLANLSQETFKKIEVFLKEN